MLKLLVAILIVSISIVPVYGLNHTASEPDSDRPVGDIFSSAVEGAKSVAREGIGGTAALVLIIGGLFIILVVVPVSMINSLYWRKSNAPNTDRKSNTMYRMGVGAGKAVDSHHVDDMIDSLKEIEDVEVKVINSTTKYSTVRIKGCRSCKDKKSNEPVCFFERGFLNGAFSKLHKSVEVVETICRAKDKEDYCEFDIRYKR